MQTFAVSAATAVALAQSVQADRLRGALAAADAERRRWARELHDETLQGLGNLRILLSGALRHEGLQPTREGVSHALVHLEREIESLRATITELRPASLDELGLRAAIESLLERHRERGMFQIDSELAILGPRDRHESLDPELESTVYRVVQEALNNASKHAGASRVHVKVTESDHEFQVEVHDNGAGFDYRGVTRGFGLAGMRERTALVGGTLNLTSDESGTQVSASLPLKRSGAPGQLTLPEVP